MSGIANDVLLVQTSPDHNHDYKEDNCRYNFREKRKSYEYEMVPKAANMTDVEVPANSFSLSDDIFEADALEQVNFQRPRCWVISIIVLSCALFLMIGFMMGHFFSRHDRFGNPKPVGPLYQQSCFVYTAFNETLSNSQGLLDQMVLSLLTNDAQSYLSILNDTQIVSGTYDDFKTLEILKQFSRKVGWGDKVGAVHETSYDIFLSYSIANKPNVVKIMDNRGLPLHEFSLESENVDDLPPYVAYTGGSDTRMELQVVYLNYGQKRDFLSALDHGILLKNKMALIRMGATSLQDMATIAKDHGVVALLLYRDPADFPHFPLNEVPYVSSFDKSEGDPSSLMDVPSVSGLPKDKMDLFQLPRVLMQTISGEIAEEIMANMTGVASPPRWLGALPNATYRMGRQFDGLYEWGVFLQTYNNYTFGRIINLCLTIPGMTEPDSYVIVGVNRNSMHRGSKGKVGEMTILLDIAKSLSLKAWGRHWYPQHTLQLCFWSGSDMGNVGMAEHIQRYKYSHIGKVIAYIDLDDVVRGSGPLVVSCSAVLLKVVQNSASKIADPSSPELSLNRTAVGFNVSRQIKQHTFVNMGVPVLHAYFAESHKEPVLTRWKSLSVVGQLALHVAISLTDSRLPFYDLRGSSEQIILLIQKLYIPKSDAYLNSLREALMMKAEVLLQASISMETYIKKLKTLVLSDVQYRIINQRLLRIQPLLVQIVDKLESSQTTLHQLRPKSKLKVEGSRFTASMLLKVCWNLVLSTSRLMKMDIN